MGLIAPELSPFQAMQVQQALAERAAYLASRRMRPGTFEAAVVEQALAATESALARVTEALYPVEPVEPDWTMPTSEDDLSLGDHFAGMSA